MEKEMSANKPHALNPAITLRFQLGHHWRGVSDAGRSACGIVFSRLPKSILLLSILAIVSVVAALYVNLRGPAPDRMTPEELTRAKMKRILICILAYQSDKKEWPQVRSWDEQLKPYFVRDAIFPPEAVLIDSWGNGIKYGIKNESGHSEAFLYSCGRNGIDDKGTNDDILIEIRP